MSDLESILAVAAGLIVMVALWCAVSRAERIRAPHVEDYGEPVENRGAFSNSLRDPRRPSYDDPGSKL